MSSEEKQALEFMNDFVEGRMTTEQFWERYKSNESIRNLLVNDVTRDHIESESMYYFAPERLIEVLDISRLEHKNELYQIVRRYFWRRNESLNFSNSDAEKYECLLKMLPTWLDVRDEDFLLAIYDSTPSDTSKTEKLKHCKNKVKELFKYDIKPPRWIQSPEWPIVNGKPLVFKGQSKEREYDERVYFYFYDSDTSEETVVTQSY